MGNHGSKSCKRKPRGLKCHNGQLDDQLSDDDQSSPENFDETSPDSYDKLLAWMVEMAENDEADLTSPAFVDHLTMGCGDRLQKYTHQTIDSTKPICQKSSEVPIHQQSLDSSSSSHSSETSKCREDLLDSKTNFRRTMLSRQSTFDYSDDFDAQREVFSGDSFESYTDTNFANPDASLINNIRETSFTNRIKPKLRKIQSFSSYRNNNANTPDLFNGSSRKRSKSLTTMRKMISDTRNDEEISPISEETVMKVLDDDMLDGNIADILYSVEALWPKTPKYLHQKPKRYSLN